MKKLTIVLVLLALVFTSLIACTPTEEAVETADEETDGEEVVELEECGNIFRDFMQQIRGKGNCMISAEDSIYVTEACLKARQSADERRVVEF